MKNHKGKKNIIFLSFYLTSPLQRTLSFKIPHIPGNQQHARNHGNSPAGNQTISPYRAPPPSPGRYGNQNTCTHNYVKVEDSIDDNTQINTGQ